MNAERNRDPTRLSDRKYEAPRTLLGSPAKMARGIPANIILSQRSSTEEDGHDEGEEAEALLG